MQYSMSCSTKAARIASGKHSVGVKAGNQIVVGVDLQHQARLSEVLEQARVALQVGSLERGDTLVRQIAPALAPLPPPIVAVGEWFIESVHH